MMRAFVIIAFFLQFISLNSFSQSSDSVIRSLDSSSKKLKEAATQFHQWEDSVQQVRLQRFTNQNSKNLDQFLAEMKQRKEAEKQQLYIRIGMGIAFLAVLGYGFYKRKKGDKRN